MDVKEILGYSAYDGIEYQTGEGTEAPTFIYADADYEIGDGKCGLHETAKQANEPAIVYVRADSFMSRNEWLQERIDILATANSWKARAEKAEAENKRLREAGEYFAQWDHCWPGNIGLEYACKKMRAALAAKEATDE